LTDGVLILVVEDEVLIEALVVSGLEDAGVAVRSLGDDTYQSLTLSVLRARFKGSKADRVV